jgi:hypothetical protein
LLHRIRDFIATGFDWDRALAEVRRTTVFTTHTPVPAGHDKFPFHMIEQHLASSWGSLNHHVESFLALGNYDSGEGPQFNMTALAMRTAGAINAVSELHGKVTREMFTGLWPDRAPGGPADRRDHERRTFRRGSRGRCRGSSSDTSAPPGAIVRGSDVLGASRRRARRRAVECAAGVRAHSRTSSASAHASAGPRPGRRGAHRRRRRDARSMPADDRLRATVQVQRPELVFRDADRLRGS